MRRPLRSVLIALGVTVPITVLLALGFRGTNAISSPLVGHRAPQFSLKTLDGSRLVSLAQFRGRPVVINFWQSSCIPCRQEHRLLLNAYKEYGRQVAFVGVSYEDSVSDAQAFLRQRGGGWPAVSDPDGETAIEYGVYGIPETFFIDRSGVVRYKRIGPVTAPLLKRDLSSIMRAPA